MTDLVKRLDVAEDCVQSASMHPGHKTLVLRALSDAITALSSQATRDEVYTECEGMARAFHRQWATAGGFEGHAAAARIIANNIAGRRGTLKQQPTEAQRTAQPDMPGFFATLTPEQQNAALAYRGDDSHPQPAPKAGLVDELLQQIQSCELEFHDNAPVALVHALAAATQEKLSELDRRLSAMGGK